MKSRWHGSLPSLGCSSPGATVPRGEKEKFGASGRSGQQTGASGCSLAVGRAAKPGNRAPRAPPRDALPGPRPAHPTPFPGRARSQRPLSETARAASKKAGRTLHPGPWASGSTADLGAAAWLPLPGCRGACWRDVPRRIGGLRPRPGPTPARRGAESGAGVRSCSLPGAPESGRLLWLQPGGRLLPPPKLPGVSRPLRAALDAGRELAHQVRKAAGILRLRLGRACF